MQARDKIGKLAMGLFDGSRDSAEANLVAALRGGQLKVEASQVPALLMIVKASIDEGFHKGYKAFLRSVDTVIAEATVVDRPTAKKK